MERNYDIKCEIYGAGLKMWEVAEAYGKLDTNFSRMLRRELPDEKKAEIRDIIARLKAEKEALWTSSTKA